MASTRTAMTWIIIVAAVGYFEPCKAEHDVVSKWRRYGGDMAVAESASVMVFCSCDLMVGLCNITMAAQFFLQDEPECHAICGGRVECAYCAEQGCTCSREDLDTYRLCQSGNRARLFQCTNSCARADVEPMCSCEITIVKHNKSTQKPVDDVLPANKASFNHGLFTGLAVGGCILLVLVVIVLALIIIAIRRRTNNRSPIARTNTNSSTAPITSSADGLKGVNNPTYEDASTTLPGTTRPPSSTSYLYPYAPRLTANRNISVSNGNNASTSASPQPSAQAFPLYQEILPRNGDQPPTYEDSEGYTRYRAQAQPDTRRERQQPVYMELVRPSDRTSRPPVDTYMY
ncbi:uncharacterized protein LOC110974372 [Acanthaster planci]|uniref:Uncharacterized protein LOC110974372 n=1 Tax=Acanthaster planci TaxID=133434 RepID=A0A8B7XNS1_ACAPL|nr:uncharacterized protein LOC110974372 [Acanthaster planci]XP_022081650.1 uncharacterized protein LOC110974372 [Acanthaster planci]